MAFKELVSPSLTDMFVRELEGMILSGELKKGEKLPTERELAVQMRVSTAVVNGGIRRLAERGFLRIAPRKGVFVADYVRTGNAATLEAILEYNAGHYQEDVLSALVDFRRIFEVRVTEDACIWRTEEHLNNLREILAQIEKGDSASALGELAYAFHHEIAIASGGLVRPLLIASFRSAYVSAYRTVLSFSGDKRDLHGHFMKLYDCIERRDPEQATAIIQDSIMRWEEAYHAHFS